MITRSGKRYMHQSTIEPQKRKYEQCSTQLTLSDDEDTESIGTLDDSSIGTSSDGDEDEMFEIDTRTLTLAIARELQDDLKKENIRLSVNDITRILSLFIDRLDMHALQPLIDTPYIEETDSSWKEGLNKEQIRKYEQELRNIRQFIKENKPKLDHILTRNVPIDEKAKIIEAMDILHSMDTHSLSYLGLKKAIQRDIEDADHGLTPEQLQKAEKVKQGLKARKKIPLKYQVLLADIDEGNRMILYTACELLEQLEGNEHEYPKKKEWVEWGLCITTHMQPTNLPVYRGIIDNPKVNMYLTEVKHKLDSRLYGIHRVKEQILMFLNNRITNPKSTNYVLALEGPRGVGKTSVGRVLAEAINLPFYIYSMAGITDPAAIKGGRYMYVGAQPGLAPKIFKNTKSASAVVFIDEFEKTSGGSNSSVDGDMVYGTSGSGNAVQEALLPIIDPTQNHQYTGDEYLEDFVMDLSHFWFVVSMNNSANLIAPLEDRLYIVKMPGYTSQEKFHIAKQFSIPRILSNLNFPCDQLILEDNMIRYLISKSPKEQGVRKLENTLKVFFTKLNQLRTATLDDGTTGQLNLTFEIKNFKIPVKITSRLIDMLLGCKDPEPWETIYS